MRFLQGNAGAACRFLNNAVPSELPNQSVPTIPCVCAEHADAAVISSTLTKLYLCTLQRIFTLRSKFNEIGELGGSDNVHYKSAMRAARIACKDEEHFLRSLDQAIQGLCNCLIMKARLSCETIDKNAERKYQAEINELRSRQERDLFTITILKKSIIYQLELPEEFLREGIISDELKARFDEKIGGPNGHI